MSSIVNGADNMQGTGFETDFLNDFDLDSFSLRQTRIVSDNVSVTNDLEDTTREFFLFQ